MNGIVVYVARIRPSVLFGFRQLVKLW